MQNKAGKFYSSLSLLIFLNAVIKPVWIFGIDRQVQNVVGTGAYGTYFSILNLSIVFSFLLDWGLTVYFNRQLASQKDAFIDKAGSFLFLKLLFALLYAAIVFFAGWLAGIGHWSILIGVVLIQVFTSLFLFFRAIITAQQWFSTDAWLSVLDKTLMVFLCGSLLYFPAVFGTITINKFLFTQTACTVLAMLCALMILLRRGVNFSVSGYSLFNKKLFLHAFPFAVVVLLMGLHFRLDGFMLERIHPNGAYEAGIYATAYRLIDASNMIGYLVASFLLPYIAWQWSHKKDIAPVILTSRHILLLFSIGLACAAYFLAPWIQQSLYHTSDEAHIKVLQLSMPALIGYSLVQVYGTVLTATGRIVAFCYINLVAVIINVLINLLLIPSLGAKGSALASLASQSFCGIAAMVYVNEKLGIRYHFRLLLMYIFTAAILSGFFYGLKDAGVSKWLLLAAGGMITLVVMIVTNIRGIKAWTASFKTSRLNLK